MMARRRFGGTGSRGVSLVEMLVALQVTALVVGMALLLWSDGERQTRRREAALACQLWRGRVAERILSGSGWRHGHVIPASGDTGMVRPRLEITVACPCGNAAHDVALSVALTRQQAAFRGVPQGAAQNQATPF